MKHNKWKSFIWITICILITMSGCKSKAVSSDADNNLGEKSPGALGRYVESDFTLPKECEGEYLNTVIKGVTGNLEIYTYSEKESSYFCYSQKEDGTFERTNLPWVLSEDPDGNFAQLDNIFYGEDQQLYAYYTVYGETWSRSLLVKVDSEKQNAQKVDLPLLAEKAREREGYTLYNTISSASVLKNGYYVISEDLFGKIYILDSTGAEITNLNTYTDASSNRQIAPFAVLENKVVTVNETGDKIIVYNTEEQKIERETPIPSYTADSKLYTTSDGTIYICGIDGISKISPEGTLWENIVDGSLCSLNTPSVSLNNFLLNKVENEKDVFYCFVYDSGDGKGKVLQFTYDSTVPSVPSKELTVYSLKENKTVRQVINQYQKENMDVKVTYNVAMQEEGSATVDDYIKALNTELLAGKGADILILDGLPKNSYIDKGVLVDMSQLIQEQVTNETLSATMFHSYLQDKSYCIPTRFEIPFVFGNEEAVGAAQSLKTLREYSEKQKEERVTTALTAGAMTKYLLSIYYPEIITSNGALDEEALGDLLLQVKQTMDYASDGEIEMGQQIQIDDIRGIKNSITTNSCAYLSIDKIKLGMGNLKDVTGMMIPFEVIASKQYSYDMRKDTYIPLGIVGINSASENKDLAEGFIQLMLSEKIQSVNLYDGFPVNQKSLQSWMEEDRDDIMVGTSVESKDGSIELMAEWPKQEQRTSLYQMLLALQTPIETDDILINKIVEESSKFYEGTSSKEETIHNILSGISTYLAE